MQCNPIQSKLSKMRASKIHSVSSHDSQATPLKTEPSQPHFDKQNTAHLYTSTHSKLRAEQRPKQQSMRKLSLLQRRSEQKAMSIMFYRQETQRRRDKYAREVLEAQERQARELALVEKQLIEEMRIERALDEQNQRLHHILNQIQESQQDELQSSQSLTYMLSSLQDRTLAVLRSKLVETCTNLSPSLLIYSTDSTLGRKQQPGAYLHTQPCVDNDSFTLEYRNGHEDYY